jgi:hypothetical protein
MEVAPNPAAPSSTDWWSHERHQLNLAGRFMLEDQTEYPCRVIDISPADVALSADRVGSPGEKVIAYLDQVGRLEGVITHTEDGGFAMTLTVSDRKKEKLAAQLHWLAKRKKDGRPDDRRHERVAPRNPMSVLHLTDGRQYKCRVIDLSLSGAAVEVDVKPAIGLQVVLGTMRGEVVRHFEEGIAIEFTNIQKAESLDSEFKIS